MAKTDNLSTSYYFQTPVYSIEAPEFLPVVRKASEKYIKKAKQMNKETIKNREKFFKIKNFGDKGLSHHSESMINDPLLSEFQTYIGDTSWNVLDHMGYDMSQYELFYTELWVQEFSKKGGGHHDGHIHYDNHISGFYFLECSEKTSQPVFHDPRYVKTMNDLPIKDPNTVGITSPLIRYQPKPGTMIFFPAYLEHQFTVDMGVDTFRFVHFNLQAVRKMITETIRNFALKKNDTNKR